jgi:hypothetical protein
MPVAATGQKGRRLPIEEAIDHFEKLLEAPCPNHRHLVQHAYKDRGLLRKFLSNEAPSGRGPKPQKDERPRGRGLLSPCETDCLLILRGGGGGGGGGGGRLKRFQ